MFRLLAGLTVVLLISGIAAGSEDAGDLAARQAAQSLADVQTYIDGVDSMEADFEQLMFDEDNEVAQVSSGKFRLLRPGKFRWDYQEPFLQTIVADGERLWIYDPDLEQVTVREMGAGLAATPASLLSGIGKIRDSYAFGNRFRSEDVDWIELRALTRDADFGQVRLGFQADELAVMDLVDSLGQTTRIYFTMVRRNPGLLPSTFEFQPPPGADVIGEDDL